MLLIFIQLLLAGKLALRIGVIIRFAQGTTINLGSMGEYPSDQVIIHLNFEGMLKMKIAALYDIHGNLPALNAVLSELSKINPDLIVIGGDIVTGPMPVETLERLFQVDIPVKYIRGNSDRYVVMASEGKPLRPDLTQKGRERMKWVAQQLSQTHLDFLDQLPETLTIPFDDNNVEVLFCHATPTSDEEIFTPRTSQQQLEQMFQGIHHKIVVCGHTHIQFERSVSSTCIINAGSVGMPFEDPPGAYWLLMTPQGYEHKYTSYNLEAAASEIRASNDPQANDFIEQYVTSKD